MVFTYMAMLTFTAYVQLTNAYPAKMQKTAWLEP